MLNVVIDLSHFQTVTSFQDIKDNGIVGVINKATEGRTYVDATYSSRRVRALSKGLLWGAFHFATKGNVSDQVNHFLDTVEPEPTDLIVLDFEPNPRAGTMSLAEAEQFVTLIHDQTNRYPGLYSGESFLKRKTWKQTARRYCFEQLLFVDCQIFKRFAIHSAGFSNFHFLAIHRWKQRRPTAPSPRCRTL